MAVDFANPAVGKMTPYTALVIFSVGIFISNFVWNVAVMKKPISGSPVQGDAYFKGSIKEHATGILGGVIWCIGMGATMVAVIWGVFIWREFATAPKGTNKLLSIVFASYILGIILIIAANS